MNIEISPTLKSITPHFHVAVMTADVTVETNNYIDDIIHEMELDLSQKFDISEVVNLDIIKDGRDAYKAYGKDPSRYRLAVESLYRRIVKGNKLYRINNVVDLGNIISLYTRKSVAVLDLDKIQGDILIRLGTDKDEYYGIGRGSINIANVPLYEDELGPFGSTTSDTDRTKITSETTSILLFIISFSGKWSLQENLEYTIDLYTKFANAKNIKSYIL